MNIVDRFGVRSFKCMMALVLATGIVPVAPALADETGPTAAEETTTPTASETSDEEASTINAAPIDNVSDEIPDIPNESPAQPNESDDPIVPSEAADSTSVAELFSDDSAIVANDTADGSPEQSTVSNIWQTWGTCEWMVDDQGCLTIRPANGAAEGQLPDTYLNTTYIPWRASEIRSSIKAIMVDSGVKTSTSCSALFGNLDKLEEADLSRLDTASATDMNHMFAHCPSLTSLDLSGWDTSRTSNMMGVFFCCSSLSSLNVSNWDTSKATNMAGMFYCCFSLASLDVSKWDTSRVTNMGTMFYSCKSLSSIDVSRWDTSQVTDIDGMFMGCQSLTSLDVSNWNTSNVTNMSGMFYDCSSVTSLDVSKWNVSKVTGMKETFKNCSSLTSLDLSGWDASNASSIEDMLSGNSGLRHIAVSDKLACDMPAPSFEGATGLWVDAETGASYDPDAVPKSTAGVYDAQLSIKDSMFSIDTSDEYYTGSPITKAITTGLTEGTDYQVTYTDNTNPGSAKITISGIGKYAGFLEYDFPIVEREPTPIEASMFSVARDGLIYDGAAHEPAVTSDVVPTGSYSVSYRDNVNAGQAAATVTASGEYSGTCELKFEIDKATPPYAIPGPLDARVGQTLADLALPDGFSWQDSSTPTGEAGEREFPATYTPTDTANYKTVDNIPITVRVTDDSANWQTWGTCEWMVDDQGCLTIRPANGAAEGQIDFGGYGADHYPWRAGSVRQTVKSIIIDKGVKAPNYCYGLFAGMKKLEKADLANLDTSSTTEISCTFEDCSRLKSLDVSSWDIGNVKKMYSLFSGCSSLASIDISGWDTSNVSDMSSLFAGCSSLTIIDISDWDTSNVSDMNMMFINCARLTSINLSRWNTSSVRDLGMMFSNCPKLSALDLSQWNTSSVLNAPMVFASCQSLRSLNLSGWNLSSAENVSAMFMSCPSLVELNLSNWNVSDMSNVFNGCSSLTSLDVSGWDTSCALNMQGMFKGCSSLSSLDTSKWDTAGVTNMAAMFSKCSSLSTLDLSNWDTPATVNMDLMFESCGKLERLDMPRFNTANVTCGGRSDSDYPFIGCGSLHHLSIGDKFALDMPAPSVEGATGLWVNAATGEAYEPDAVPKNAAGVYDAQVDLTYAHRATASQNGVTFTVQWNDAPADQATTFHVTQNGGSAKAKARMDAPTYWDTDHSQESVCDPTRGQWNDYYALGDDGHDYSFELTASGTYRIDFYFMDTENSVYYLRTSAAIAIDDPSRPSVSQIVSNAVTQAKTETDGSEYAMALWLHDWTIDQLEYDHDLNWCSAESGLTRGKGTCESYQRIYEKLLNATGIANARMTGNGHTWNAVKIDGKWCQMDLTWDDTNDNWYGDLDQRHLYFGLTDELMAIAHSDHTKNYQAEGYAYRSTDLSNNYFVRNGKADEWASAYTERIQQHLDAKETSFSIDADNGTFPPSISGIQNAIIAYAMNQRDWSTAEASVTLVATSNVVVNSSTSWTVRYDVEAGYSATTYYVKYYLSENCSALVFEDSAPFDSPYALKGFSELTGSGEQATCFMGWKMRRDSDGKWFARNASGARFVALNDGKLPDGFSFVLVKDAGKLLKAASAGSGVSLYAQLKDEDTYRIKYYPSESGSEPVAEQVVPYSRSAPIASLSSLGLSDDSSSFKGWKMRRTSDGKWFAQNQAGIKRYVGLIDGKLPDGYDYCLLKDGANLLRAASVGSSVGLYAVMDSPSYVVKYFSAGDAGEPVKSVVAPYTTAYQLESIESLGLLGDGKTFVGWKLHRVADDKWYAVSNGKTRYVSLVDGKLPAGYSYRLVRDEGNLLKAAPQGTTLQLFAQWG